MEEEGIKTKEHKLLKMVLKIIGSILLAVVLLVVGVIGYILYEFSAMYKIDVSKITVEEKQVMIENMSLQYVPESLTITKGEYPKIAGGGGDPEFDIYFTIDEKDYDNFMNYNSAIHTNGKETAELIGNRNIQQIKSKEKNKVYFKCICASDMASDFKQLREIFNKYVTNK